MEKKEIPTGISSSKRFYENVVSPMLKEKFPEYENRIAVGIVGEGSDCFGYDDFISRDHDFGTGVCLWLTDKDMSLFGRELSEIYEGIVDKYAEKNLSRRLRERRGVMTIHGFYSSILGTDIDVNSSEISEETWKRIDHNCLATAVNGTVFRDELGQFTRFRNLLLDYYPDKIWKNRIVDELHRFSAALQVNYGRCMSRGDVVAARMCHMQGLESAMQLFFLMKRVYPPYYKWTYRRLEEIDSDGYYAKWIKDLSETLGDTDVWAGRAYNPNYLNLSDPIVVLAERLADRVANMLKDYGLIEVPDPYLERHVDTIIKC